MARQAFTLTNMSVLRSVAQAGWNGSIAMDAGFFADGLSTHNLTYFAIYAHDGQVGALVEFQIDGSDPGPNITDHDDLSITMRYYTGTGDSRVLRAEVELYPIPDTFEPYTFLPAPANRAAYNAFTDALPLDIDRSVLDMEVEFSNDSRAQPVELAIAGGTPALTAARLKAGPIREALAAGTPAMTAEMPRPLLILPARVAGGMPALDAWLKPGSPDVGLSAGEPDVFADLLQGLKLSLFIGAGVPALDDAWLKPGPPDLSLAGGTPTLDVGVKPSPIDINLAEGTPTVDLTLHNPQIGPALAAGAPTIDVSISRPLAIPGTPRLNLGNPYIDEFSLNAGSLGVELSAGDPSVDVRLYYGVRDVELSTGDPTVTADFVGGARVPVFRFVPDIQILRNRDTSVTLPRVANEIPGGTYAVAGLPEGLTYDSATHMITGRTTNVPGEVTVTLTYTEPADA